jgi:hypothetical protein
MHLKLDKLITKNVNGIAIQIYATLIAYLILQLIEIPQQWGQKLLDKLRYLQACMCQEISYVHWMTNILTANGAIYRPLQKLNFSLDSKRVPGSFLEMSYVNELDDLFRHIGDTQANAIDLLILSACRTAAGNDRAVLGIAGTTVRAGARSAIAGLWSLADISSPKFTQTLYQYLGKPGITRSEALRRAQLALLQDRSFTHPRYWAPYVLIGSWL